MWKSFRSQTGSGVEESEHIEIVGRRGKLLEAVGDVGSCRKHWKVWENVGSFRMCGW